MKESSEEKILEIEQNLRGKEFRPSADFSARVMRRIEERQLGFFRRLFMNIAQSRKLIMGSTATAVTAMLCVAIMQQQGERIIPPTEVPTVHRKEFDSAPVGPVVPQVEEQKANTAGQKISPPAHSTQDEDALLSTEAINEPAFPQGKSRRLDGGMALQKSMRINAGDLTVESASAAPAAVGMQPAPDVWRQPNTEQYLHYGENQRVDARAEPVSTFGLDVDTASYANVRRFLQSGQLPPADAVRVEEFINYFDYNYPSQTDKPFTVSYEVAPSPLEQNKFLLKLGVKARDAEAKRVPWNLVFLVDVSGSMADPGKLDLVKPTLKLIVNQMRTGDRIAIVTYAGNAGVALESSGIEQRGKIISAIDGLSSGGSTNGAGGIQAAYQIAERNLNREGVNRVVLATDGDFNVGITSLADLIRLIEEKRKSGVGLTTLGFGSGNLKDGTMEQLANNGNGNYFYIDSFREAGKVLEKDLVGNMQTVAKDVKVQVEFNPEKVAQYRLIGYENRKLNREDFNNDTVDSGEVGIGHTVTALYELVMAGSSIAPNVDELRYQSAAREKSEIKQPPAGFADELAFVKVRYKEPAADKSNLLSFPLKAADLRKHVSESSDDFRFAAAVAYFAQILRGSSLIGEVKLDKVAELASRALGSDAQGLRHEFVDLVRSAERLRSTPQVEPILYDAQ